MRVLMIALGDHPDNRWVDEFKRLIAKFDARPFETPCAGCGATATRASAYRNSSSLMFWCDNCDPYSSGADRGKLTMIRTYQEALRHVGGTFTAPRTEKRNIILALAHGKGLAKRLTEDAAKAFLA